MMTTPAPNPSPRKVLIINQAFYPDLVATAQHMTDWADHLAQRGHSVTVIASRSLYGQSKATLPRRETRGTIAIRRVGGNFFAKGRLLTRLVDFAFFHFHALCTTLFLLPRQDVVVCLTSPPFIGIAGRLAKLFRRSATVQYEMDVYPDIAIALGALKPGTIPARLLDGLHRHLLRHADHIVVLGRCMRQVIAAKGIPESRIALVTPWADADEIDPVPRAENPFRNTHNLADKFVVMYSGNLGLGHDVTTICQAMQQLASDPRIAFVFIGAGKRMSEVQSFIQQHNLPSPLFLEYQPRAALSQTLSDADAHLITQAPGTAGLIVPSKFYGILAAGRPALYVGPENTEIALAIREHKLGSVIPLGDSAALVQAIQGLLDQATGAENFTVHARAVLRNHFGREACCEKLTALIESLPA